MKSRHGQETRPPGGSARDDHSRHCRRDTAAEKRIAGTARTPQLDIRYEVTQQGMHATNSCLTRLREQLGSQALGRGMEARPGGVSRAAYCSHAGAPVVWRAAALQRLARIAANATRRRFRIMRDSSLLDPKCHHRLNTCSAPGGNHGGHQGCQAKQQRSEREHDRIPRLHAE